MEEPPNIAETLQRLIEEEIINTEDDDSDFFFYEKWQELMELPETLANNESDYVETEKMNWWFWQEFFNLPWSSYDNPYKNGADSLSLYVSQHK